MSAVCGRRRGSGGGDESGGAGGAGDDGGAARAREAARGSGGGNRDEDAGAGGGGNDGGAGGAGADASEDGRGGISSSRSGSRSVAALPRLFGSGGGRLGERSGELGGSSRFVGTRLRAGAKVCGTTFGSGTDTGGAEGRCVGIAAGRWLAGIGAAGMLSA
jgi:hypothetical protein